MKMLDDSRKNEFVNLFPTNKKSGICNKILEQIRAGESYRVYDIHGGQPQISI